MSTLFRDECVQNQADFMAAESAGAGHTADEISLGRYWDAVGVGLGIGKIDLPGAAGGQAEGALSDMGGSLDQLTEWMDQGVTVEEAVARIKGGNA